MTWSRVSRLQKVRKSKVAEKLQPSEVKSAAVLCFTGVGAPRVPDIIHLDICIPVSSIACCSAYRTLKNMYQSLK